MPVTRIQLEYFHPWPNHAGFFVAEERGYFAEEGIDVEVNVRDPLRGYPIAHLERREVDFGVDLICNLLTARGHGARLQAVASIDTLPMDAILTLADCEIRTPADLAGKSIGIVESDHLKAQLVHMLAANGVKESDVDLRLTGKHEPTLPDVRDGAYDAGYAYFAWEGVLNPELAESTIVMRATDFGGLKYQPYGLIVAEDVIQRAPSYIASVVRAVRRGYEAARDDRDLALYVIDRVLPFIPAEVRAASYDAIKPLWFDNGVWGALQPKLLEEYAVWLKARGLLASEVDAVGAYHIA